MAARHALVLAATSDSGDLLMLGRAAALLAIDLSALAAAENLGLVRLGAASVEFRHPLARSAVYADATADRRREAHRALAAALPDRDVDCRAWHLASAAPGADEAASAALEQAGPRSRDRSAYATAAGAFERAGGSRTTPSGARGCSGRYLARESDQQTGLVFGLAGLAFLSVSLRALPVP